MNAKQAKKLLTEEFSCDKVVVRKTGRVEVYRSYFYRHGMSAEQLLDRLVRFLDEQGVKAREFESEDRWAQWPKTSYFVASFVPVD